jgi:hypothetical protein
MFSSYFAQELTGIQKGILRLAHERLLANEDLSFGEILVDLYGCRPEYIGLRRVQKLPQNEVLNICRLEPHEEFHFAGKVAQDKYGLAQASASADVAWLVERGLLITVKTENLIWAKDQPRVERIGSFRMIRLTEEGEKIVADKRRHQRHSFNLPMEYHRADSKTGHPAFTLNISEKGLLIDLPDELEVGQNLKLRIPQAAYDPIEIFAQVVWTNPPSRKGGGYRSGMRISRLSAENRDKLRILLGQPRPDIRGADPMASSRNL